MNPAPLNKKIAKMIIHQLGSSGTPPRFGVEHFSVGLDIFLKIIEDEYLKDILKLNLSSFKMITGNYGGGKTHFLLMIRNLAWKNGYVTSYAQLGPTECPFDRLELVYKNIVLNIAPPSKDKPEAAQNNSGIDLLLKRISKKGVRNLLSKLSRLESSSFANACKAAIDNLRADDEEGFYEVIQWLKGEEVSKDLRLRYRISERIDRSNAFRMLRSLVQFINAMGYSGLILLFDEAERGMSISSSRDKRRALDNLRQLVDECGNSRLPGAMFFYAIPDENLLLEGSGGVYEALKQRLRSNFTTINPLGVKINLEELGPEPAEFLTRLGKKLKTIFEIAYDCELNDEYLTPSMKNLIETALELQALDISYRRIFVVGIIEAFQRLKQEQKLITTQEAQEILRSSVRMLSEKERKEIESEEY